LKCLHVIKYVTALVSSQTWVREVLPKGKAQYS
jgi:hypothetical protein